MSHHFVNNLIYLVNYILCIAQVIDVIYDDFFVLSYNCNAIDIIIFIANDAVKV